MERLNRILYGVFIYDKQKYKKISIKGLADYLGVSQSTPYKWIERPEIDIPEKYINKIIKYLKEQSGPWWKVVNSVLDGSGLTTIEIIIGRYADSEKETKEAAIAVTELLESILKDESKEKKRNYCEKALKEVAEMRESLLC